ncbi:Abi family protein [Staphylococcus pasteuri]|uniref:Abi family protein n=1 Tax=Staphylococcus pasteuri TaxID=45972 RepID=UPI0030C2B430
MTTRKPILDYTSQIKKLKRMGINFNIINEDKAKDILRDNTYLFKISYYRKNFYKYEDGYRIEFAYLSDLSNIDMRFRYTLLHMTLDIEHAIKCLVLKLVTEDENEDGYDIINDFLSIDRSRYQEIDSDHQPLTLEQIKAANKEQLFKHLKKQQEYPSKIQKYINDPPIWFCIEIMQLGQLTSFVEFYYERCKNDQLKIPSKLMKLMKNIRNKCAHNQAILINLGRNEETRAPRELMSMSSIYQLPNSMFKVRTFIDILATFELHNLLCSKGIKKGRKPAILELKSRYKLHFSYYKKAIDIQKFFSAMDKIIDSYSQKI